MSRPSPPESGGGPRLAVVIVDWNSGDLIGRCLGALARQTAPADRIVVVDNASAIETPQRLGAKPPRTEIVRLPENRGFAAGSNHGIQAVGDVEWVALLNPDAFPAPDWLERLRAAVGAHPDFSFFASRQVLADDPARLDGTGDCYAVSGLAWRRDHGQPVDGRGDRPEEVFGPCAAAALYRRDALADAGGLDASFFCYFEDVDLAFRLRLAGHRCLYVPDAVVQHVGSASSGRRSDFSVYHGHRNLVWTFWKNMPLPLLAAYWPHHLALNAASLVHFAARGQGRAILRAKRDAFLGLPGVLSVRRPVQARRRVGSPDLRRVMVGGLRALGLGRSTSVVPSYTVARNGGEGGGGTDERDSPG